METMESKHTPGPWEAEIKDGRPTGRIINWVRAVWIADVHGFPSMWMRATEKVKEKNEWQANALLIAAAPDLLAALSRVREAWGDTIREDTEIDGADLVDWLVSWYNLEVMPALRKAEGEG